MNRAIDTHPPRQRPRPGQRTASTLATLLATLPLITGPGVRASDPPSEPNPGTRNTGSEVAVVFNSSLPESADIARHYAKVRGVPDSHLVGLDLPPREQIDREAFRLQLQEPLARSLEEKGLLQSLARRNGTADDSLRLEPPVARARIRYLVLCHGVPVRILEDASLKNDTRGEVRREFNRNEAAVDSELAVLPGYRAGLPLTGPLANPVYGTTNAHDIHPERGILIVSRLDGPSPTIARRLVDLAVQAETNGLWGNAYFDLRGITEGDYKTGDEWIRDASKAATLLGFPTTVDENPETLPPEFPFSRAALYAGWYSGKVDGPFAAGRAEFMPGAVAYHLHSYSAAILRSPRHHWAGPLLDLGATATLGCVAEPYLRASPDVRVFFTRLLLFGFTFGEAAAACQNALSWQTTVIGDPLYAPFQTPLQERVAAFENPPPPEAEWAAARLVRINELAGRPPEALADFLRGFPRTPTSGILQHELARLEADLQHPEAAHAAFTNALQHAASPQEQVRIALDLAEFLESRNRKPEAADVLEQLLARDPGYPAADTLRSRIRNLREPRPEL